MTEVTACKPVRALAESSIGKTAVALGTTIYSLSPASVALLARAASLLKAQLPSDQQAQVDDLLVQFKTLDSSIDLMDDTIDTSISLIKEKKDQTTNLITEKTAQATILITEKKVQATTLIGKKTAQAATLITDTTAQATTLVTDTTAQATVTITHHLEALQPFVERLEPILDSLLTADEGEVEHLSDPPSPAARLTNKVSKRMHKRWKKIADGVTDLKSRTVQLAHLDLIAYDQLPMRIGKVSKQSAALVGGAVTTSVAVSRRSLALVGGVLQGRDSVEHAWSELLGTFPPLSLQTQDFLTSTQSSAGELFSTTHASLSSRVSKAKTAAACAATSAATSANDLFEQHILPSLPAPLRVIWADLLQWRAAYPQLSGKKLAEAQSESGQELKKLPEGSSPVEEFRKPSDMGASVVLEDVTDEVMDAQLQDDALLQDDAGGDDDAADDDDAGGDDDAGDDDAADDDDAGGDDDAGDDDDAGGDDDAGDDDDAGQK
jgi:hypothetical protein